MASKEKYLTAEVLDILGVEPEDHKLVIVKLTQARRGYVSKKKLKDGIEEYSYEPKLSENIHYMKIGGTILYTKKGVEEVKRLFAK